MANVAADQTDNFQSELTRTDLAEFNKGNCMLNGVKEVLDKHGWHISRSFRMELGPL